MDAAIGLVGLTSAAFLASHVGLAYRPARAWIVNRSGEKGFRGFYSLVALLTLGAMIAAYVYASHHIYLWIPGHGLRHLPLLIMPVAFALIAGGIMAPHPLVVGAGSSSDRLSPVKGALRITRHPIAWGITLWAAVHILANGDLASVLFFGGFLLTAVLGSLHLDRRMAIDQSERWQQFAAVTSHVPFAAILNGRQTWTWAELIWPGMIGLGVFASLLLLHPYLFGVRPY